jgi:hypothetical protein
VHAFTICAQRYSVTPYPLILRANISYGVAGVAPEPGMVMVTTVDDGYVVPQVLKNGVWLPDLVVFIASPIVIILSSRVAQILL